MAGSTSRSVSYVVSTRTRAPIPSLASSLMAATPSMTGIRRSMRMTSGFSARASSTARAPSPASPSTSKPGSPANMPRMPSRTMGWSSAMSSRIGSVTGHRRDARGDRGAAAGLRLDLQGAGQAADAPAHRGQAETAAVPYPFHVEARAVVAHVQRHHVLHVGKRQPDPGGAGVLGRVGEGLLGGAEQGLLHLGVQGADRAGGGEVGAHPVELAPLGGDLAQRLRQRGRVELAGADRVDGAPGLGQ